MDTEEAAVKESQELVALESFPNQFTLQSAVSCVLPRFGSVELVALGDLYMSRHSITFLNNFASSLLCPHFCHDVSIGICLSLSVSSDDSSSVILYLVFPNGHEGE